MKSVSRGGVWFVNWHNDHYDQGVAKNLATHRRFKRVARILKNVKRDMLENGDAVAVAAAKDAPSFLIECMAFNAPNTCFGTSEAYAEDVEAVLIHLFVGLKDDEAVRDMVEVSVRKRLFSSGQPWTRARAQAFVVHAFAHLGF